VFELIPSVKPKRIHNFKPQEAANLSWALATAGRPHPVLFDQLANQLAATMKTKAPPKPQQFSNSLWAFATCGIRSPAHVRICRQILVLIDDDGSLLFFAHIANLICAHTNL
jgi:hypothetical protein